MKVNEIYYSIQGESSYAGYPCVFVRLSGCNLRCSYCDTQYAYDEGHELSLSQIIEQVQRYHCSLVEITGGEPLLQKDTPQLISKLLDKDLRVLLETNGSIDVRMVDRRCIKIIDMKLPTSGESAKNYLENINLLQDKDELKFVIGGQEDYLYAKQMLLLLPKERREKMVINFSPRFAAMEPRQLAAWMLADCLDVRLNLQLHKIIWPSDLRGV